MTFFAVIDEAGFKTRLNAGDNALVDIGLAGLTTGHFNIDVDELLPVDNPHSGFFRMGRIKKHAFHVLALQNCYCREQRGVPEGESSVCRVLGNGAGAKPS